MLYNLFFFCTHKARCFKTCHFMVLFSIKPSPEKIHLPKTLRTAAFSELLCATFSHWVAYNAKFTQHLSLLCRQITMWCRWTMKNKKCLIIAKMHFYMICKIRSVIGVREGIFGFKIPFLDFSQEMFVMSIKHWKLYFPFSYWQRGFARKNVPKCASAVKRKFQVKSIFLVTKHVFMHLVFARFLHQATTTSCRPTCWYVFNWQYEIRKNFEPRNVNVLLVCKNNSGKRFCVIEFKYSLTAFVTVLRFWHANFSLAGNAVPIGVGSNLNKGRIQKKSKKSIFAMRFI